ncbi:MAG: MgtC/SapB family protein [bacterium]|nr:MgtC/SapB family protein [bacterium]
MIDSNEVVLRLFLSALFGGIIGVEREWRNKAAGLRTNMLICLGSCLLMILSLTIVEGYEKYMADPTRIAAQIVSGIGFLGAGAIIRAKFSVIGITTAASIWLTSGIGMAVGSGNYYTASISLLITIIVLQVFSPLEKLFKSKIINRLYHIKFRKDSSSETGEVISKFYHSAVNIVQEITYSFDNELVTMSFSVNDHPQKHDKFISELKKDISVLELYKI